MNNQELAKSFSQALCTWAWFNDYYRFCEDLNFAPNLEYSENKWGEFQELVKYLGQFDLESLTKIIDDYRQSQGDTDKASTTPTETKRSLSPQWIEEPKNGWKLLDSNQKVIGTISYSTYGFTVNSYRYATEDLEDAKVIAEADAGLGEYPVWFEPDTGDNYAAIFEEVYGFSPDEEP